MAVYAISDLHLSLSVKKPMDVFGARWERYMEKIESEWSSTVSDGDTVLLPGDFCWALRIDEAVADFQFLHALPGKKIMSKGNHDYWWATMSKMNQFLERHGFDSISFLQNSAALLERGRAPFPAGGHGGRMEACRAAAAAEPPCAATATCTDATEPPCAAAAEQCAAATLPEPCAPVVAPEPCAAAAEPCAPVIATEPSAAATVLGPCATVIVPEPRAATTDTRPWPGAATSPCATAANQCAVHGNPCAATATPCAAATATPCADGALPDSCSLHDFGTVAVAAAKGWLGPGMPGFGEDDAKLFARERGRLAASLAKAAALLPHGQPSSAAPPQSQLSPASQPHRQPLTYDRPSSATHPHGQPLSHGQPLPHGQPQPPMPLPAMPLSHSQPQPAVPFPTMPPRALIAMLHYPPLSKAGLDAGFLDIISEYRPAICIYGHLHGAHAELAFEGRIGATVYRMVSADHLGFRPLRLL